MEKKKVTIEEKVSRGVLAERLRKMALDLENGRLEVQGGNETILFSYAETMPIEIAAKRKETKEKLVIEMSWRMLPVPAGGETTPQDEPKATANTGADESSGNETTASSSEAAGSMGSPPSPEQSGETIDPGNRVTPSSGETNSLPGEEAKDESSSPVSGPAAGEDAAPPGQPRPRTGRRRK